ncbi:hypothetical protein COCOBI_09-0350 [Coccomyxa sp. Obi]|nr:hypothetical protein COCOBI_09-0350 [Coccomyxa sp. Obi]
MLLFSAGRAYAAVPGVVNFKTLLLQQADNGLGYTFCLSLCDTYACSAVAYQEGVCYLYSGSPAGGGQVNNVTTTYFYVAQTQTVVTLNNYAYEYPTGARQTGSFSAAQCASLCGGLGPPACTFAVHSGGTCVVYSSPPQDLLQGTPTGTVITSFFPVTDVS